MRIQNIQFSQELMNTKLMKRSNLDCPICKIWKGLFHFIPEDSKYWVNYCPMCHLVWHWVKGG